MVIHIPDRIVVQAQKRRKLGNILKLIFYLFESGKHKWYIKNNNLDLFMNSDILNSYNDFMEKYIVENQSYNDDVVNYIVRFDTKAEIELKKQDLIDSENLILSILLDGRRMVVSNNDTIYDFISVEMAEKYIGRPLVILIENIESDKLFVETCLKTKTDLDCNSIWIEYLHGGGQDIIKVAKDIAGERRVVLIKDSDRCSSPQKGESKHTELMELCNKLGYTLHILKKREMENYIPEDALKNYLKETGRNFEDYYYFYLSDDAKDYFDMKNGFCNKFDINGKLCPKGYECVVWNRIPQTVLDELASSGVDNNGGEKLSTQGFGNKIWNAFKYVTNEDDLKSRDNSNEINEIVEKIVTFI